MPPRFVHLHNHTQYSLLDGAQKIGPMLERARSLGMDSVAVTDHGNLFGAIEFHDKAREIGIKPILGCEAYIAPGSRFDRTPPSSGGKPYYHLILLAENDTGFRNLIQLVSRGYTEGFYYRPRIDWELLEKHREGLIATSACLGGEVATLLRQGRERDAEGAAARYRDLLGDRNYYLEIQDQEIDEQKRIDDGLRRLAGRMGIPLLATNDCHFSEPDDHHAHDVLICIQTNTTVLDPQRMTYTPHHYFKSPKEMAQVFRDIPDAVLRTQEIAERCNVTIPRGINHLPAFDIPEGHTEASYFRRVVEDGWEWRLRSWKELERQGRLRRPLEEYRRRLDYEIEVIVRLKFAGYFLIVWDFIRYARENGIPVGPGRGSAVGSLVAYCMGITNMDPMPYGLIFERFLNPDRIEFPDIDIDFCQRRRGEVIDYVTQKYGRDNVAQIITFGAMNARQVVRDAARGLSMPYAEADRIAKLMPAELNTTLESAHKAVPQIRDLVERDPRVAELWQVSRRLEGLVRHASVHAAGVVIAPRPITEFAPLFRSNRDEITTQWPWEDIVRVGLLKMDFLGLRTLTVLDDARRTIEAGLGPDEITGEVREKIDFDALPLDDVPTFERIFQAGRTDGVFQFESSGMKDLLRRVRPDAFEDLIALNGLYRPGPIGSGMIDDYIERRKNPGKVKYPLPGIEDVLRPTYGVIVFQEQVMEIARRVAGFTMSEADILRKAMGKKKVEVMEAQREKFVAGAEAKGVSASRAADLFDLMAHFAGYGFNMSHSAAYALVAYQTAWLKAHYPRHFMAALLTSEKEHTDKVVRYKNECAEMGIQLLPPDINASDLDFTVSGPDIRFGLSAIKGIGESATRSVLDARARLGRFATFSGFVESIDLRLCNRKTLECFVKAGCFDSLGYRRSQLFGAVEGAMERAQKAQKDRMAGQSSLFGGPADPGAGEEHLPAAADWTDREMLAFEKETLGYYVTSHPLQEHQATIARVASATTSVLAERAGQEVAVAGIFTGGERRKTKKGEMMYRALLEDMEGSAECVVFPKTYQESFRLCQDDLPVLVRGRVEIDNDRPKLLASAVSGLEEARTRTARSVVIHVPADRLDDETLFRAEKIVSANRGGSPVSFVVSLEGRRLTVQAGPGKRVQPSEAFRASMEKLLGPGSVEYVF